MPPLFDPSALVWLKCLHRQWYAARGKGVKIHAREYRCDWDNLLDEAGLFTAADRALALSEAESLAQQGLLSLYRHKHRRYLLERIGIPLTAEKDLSAIFSSKTAREKSIDSLPLFHHWQQQRHPLYPAAWEAMMGSLLDALNEVKMLAPFDWSDLEHCEEMLRSVYQLTAQEWPAPSAIRQVSVALGHDSKWLEKQRSKIEKALSLLFGQTMSIDELGIVANDYLLEMSGPLRLHFADDRIVDLRGLQSVYAIAASDLAQCVSITTTARRLLSIENRKTTFRHCAIANQEADTLLVATSYPTQAFRSLLEKLPATLPCHHFGDTDPAGWHILAKIRELCRPDVQAFAMEWRPHPPHVFSAFDETLLKKLPQHPHLQDQVAQIEAMIHAGHKGNFEQESLGPPDLRHWPFWSLADIDPAD